ncbi:sensor histidine kinase [Marisediminicola senii]|uniref:sensor histidine kinase n=1 Tax=Marisediminicola senii TaxID=2711233 RepID=UPI0013ED3CF1|nr:HAMP domain-containing sensor histidine kinase [Marisediminicola senii]
MTQPWTLRRRLVLSTVALLAAMSIVIGFVSVLALRSYLVDRVDIQLQSATSRSQDFGGNAVAPGSVGDQVGIRPEFLAVGTISASITGGVLDAAIYFDDDGYVRILNGKQGATLVAVPADGTPRTVDLGGLGTYRVVSQPVDRAGSAIVVALPLTSVQSTVFQLGLVIAIVTIVGIALATVGARWIVRYALRPLDRVAATASHVAELPLDRGQVALAVRVPDADADGRTEVGQVGAAINRMLGHVASALHVRQESERKVRQFVADASHELRTPLASIRGYAELTRRGGHDLPPDVVHAIGRVESEAVRMTSLVEDLLLLARLDEGRDLEMGDVDVSMLLIDAVSDAHAAGPDHGWSLDLPEEPVTIRGDKPRLQQVVVNILANARVHTPPGTPVQVALRLDGDTALITVTDHGPGIPEQLQPQLFERFARGDGSRSRTAGSTGLGLAIVRAVVDGHGGSVQVQSEPGTTVFSIALPVGGPPTGTARPAATEGVNR